MMDVDDNMIAAALEVAGTYRSIASEMDRYMMGEIIKAALEAGPKMTKFEAESLKVLESIDRNTELMARHLLA